MAALSGTIRNHAMLWTNPVSHLIGRFSWSKIVTIAFWRN